MLIDSLSNLSNFSPGTRPTYRVARARVAASDFLSQPWSWAKRSGGGGGGGGLQWMSTEHLMRQSAKLGAGNEADAADFRGEA